MGVCNKCGGKIVFRYQGGQPIPIHINGGWCSSVGSNGGGAGSTSIQFASAASYVNPDAECPVCHQRVFFYRSPHGGRVFFDDLGWPWPKHPCTDMTAAQSKSVKTFGHVIFSSFRNRNGEHLEIYKLVSALERKGMVELHFSTIRGDRSFRGVITTAALRTQNITVADLNDAPSFVVRKYPTHRLLDFISARKGCIDTIQIPRSKPVQALLG